MATKLQNKWLILEIWKEKGQYEKRGLLFYCHIVVSNAPLGEHF